MSYLFNNLTRDTRKRELEDGLCTSFQRVHHVTPDLVQRIGLEAELEGHNGCVNCLEWNQEGTLLASGSDDVHIVLWEPFTHKKLTSMRTNHNGNIFSVKFLPFSNDNTVVSGAADCKICVHDISAKETTHVFGCHAGRVKRLAVAPNLPNMFWSAAEDGTIMQFDIRCPDDANSVKPRNVIVNLKAHAGAHTEAKCLAINSLRPEQLAVGANDPYVRLYDRRMLTCRSISFPGEANGGRTPWERQNLLTEFCPSEDFELPQDAGQYFVPAHLPQKQNDFKKRYRTLASTYITFSPNGSELLVNLGGEQIYLFDVNRTRTPKLRLDLPVQEKPTTNSAAKVAACVGSNGFSLPKNGTSNGVTNGVSRHLTSATNQSTPNVEKEPKRKHKRHKYDCKPLPPFVQALKQRANSEFEKDRYTHAITYYNKAIAMVSDAPVLYGNRAAAFMKRGWDGDVYSALRDCHSAIKLDPNHLKAHFRLSRCLYELSWTDEAYECLQFFKSKFPDYASSQACEGLDRDIKAALFAKTEEAESGKTESKSTRSSALMSEQEKAWRGSCGDYELRLCGHCNTTTDIKEANFFGSNGQYIVAGSDDGSFYIWERNTTNIVRVLRGDDSIVNCLQPHPSYCLLATSGIDPVVRLWSPRPEDGQKDEREVDDSDNAASANQKRMNADPLEVMLMNMGYRISGVMEGEEEEEMGSGSESRVGCRTS